MPSMANITVKAADGTTDVTYTAKTASAGDKIAAVWTNDAASGIIGYRPKFMAMTRNNGSNNARILEASLALPVIFDPGTGVFIKLATVVCDVRAVIPTNVDVDDVKEGFAQFGNLLVSTLMRQVAETGYSPT